MGLEDRIADGSIKDELFEHTPTAIQIVDCNGTILMANPSTAALTGIDTESLVGQSTFSLLSDEHAERFIHKCEIIKERGMGKGIYSIMNTNGETTPVLRKCVARYDEKTGLFEGGFIFDTNYKQPAKVMKMLLADRRNRKKSIEDAPIGMFQTRPDGRIIDINPAAARIWGFNTPAEMKKNLGNIIETYVDPEDRETLLQKAHETGYIAEREVLFKRTDGSTFWAELNLGVQYRSDGGISRYEGYISDITERKKSMLELMNMAYYDPKTHLPNENLFADRATQIIQYVRRENGGEAAILLADLDKFKSVNDTYGHHVGDRILKKAGRRMANSIRGYDTVARLGGDEYGIILQNTSRELAEIRAKGIREEVSKPYKVNIKGKNEPPEYHEVNIGVTIGIAICPHDGVIPSDLLRVADKNMYANKRA